VLLISRAVETTPQALQAGGACFYEGMKTRSNLIRLRVVGEPYINGLDGHWISRPNSTNMASPSVSHYYKGFFYNIFVLSTLSFKDTDEIFMIFLPIYYCYCILIHHFKKKLQNDVIFINSSNIIIG
jgi:hypothetical protein